MFVNFKMRFYNKAFKGFKRKYIRTLKIENKKNKQKKEEEENLYITVPLYSWLISELEGVIFFHIFWRILSAG